jgi:hypothetical protein
VAQDPTREHLLSGDTCAHKSRGHLLGGLRRITDRRGGVDFDELAKNIARHDAVRESTLRRAIRRQGDNGNDENDSQRGLEFPAHRDNHTTFADLRVSRGRAPGRVEFHALGFSCPRAVLG